MSHSSFAIIPARGGSKRLKRKNILPLHGKPLIAWSIESALNAACIDAVYVSSEDKEIIEISQSFGANILERSQNLSSDTARVDEVCFNHFLEDSSIFSQYDSFCCLYPTAPLRTSNDIDQMMNILSDDQSKCDGVIAVSPYSHYPFQALYVDNESFLKPYWPQHILKKGSDFPAFYAGNGSTYCFTMECFMQEMNFFPLGRRIKPYIMPPLRSIDVDTQQDFDLLNIITKEVDGQLHCVA